MKKILGSFSIASLLYISLALFSLYEVKLLAAISIVSAGHGGTSTPSGASPFTYSYTSGSSSTRALGICVVTDATIATTAITAVSYGGDAATLVTNAQDSSFSRSSSLYGLIGNAHTGAQNVSITLANNQKIASTVVEFSGVNQGGVNAGSFANGAAAHSTFGSDPATVNVTNSSGNVAIDCLGSSNTGTFISNQTEQTREANDILGASSTSLSTGTVTMSYSNSGAEQWAMGTASVIAAAGGAAHKSGLLHRK